MIYIERKTVFYFFLSSNRRRLKLLLLLACSWGELDFVLKGESSLVVQGDDDVNSEVHNVSSFRHHSDGELLLRGTAKESPVIRTAEDTFLENGREMETETMKSKREQGVDERRKGNTSTRIPNYLHHGGLHPNETHTLEEQTSGLKNQTAEREKESPGEILGAHAISCPIPRIPAGTNTSTFRATSFDNIHGRVHLLGLGLDGTKFRAQHLAQLLELNCEFGVSIHVSTQLGARELTDKFRAAQERCYGHDPQLAKSQCGFVKFYRDPPETKSMTNRVARIAYARDHLRASLRAFHATFSQHHSLDRPDASEEAVVMFDADLYSIPSNFQILTEAHRIIHGTDYDVVCAAGLMHHPFGYYDIFATVLNDDTFVFPLRGRLHHARREEETASLIRSDVLFGNFTQENIFRYLKETGSQNIDGIAPVRSCFGGLAIYRMSSLLDEACSYHKLITDAEVLKKYSFFANVDDGIPCEHILFHDCLRHSRTRTATNIGIQPNLTTWWDEPYFAGHFIGAGGEISEGLRRGDGLIRYANQPPEVNLFLRNGNFRCQIDESGILVIEDLSTLSADRRMPNVTWRLPLQEIEAMPQQAKMEYAFLTLEDRGEIVLTYQFRLGFDQDCPFPALRTIGDACRQEVWRSQDYRGDDDPEPILHLGKDGILRVIDAVDQRVLWHSSPVSPSAIDIQDLLKTESLPDMSQCTLPLPRGPTQAPSEMGVPNFPDDGIAIIIVADSSFALYQSMVSIVEVVVLSYLVTRLFKKRTMVLCVGLLFAIMIPASLSINMIDSRPAGDVRLWMTHDIREPAHKRRVDWIDLPHNAREAATTLGYNQRMWNQNQQPVALEKYWDHLTRNEKAAAKELGYDKEKWDKDDCLFNMHDYIRSIATKNGRSSSIGHSRRTKVT